MGSFQHNKFKLAELVTKIEVTQAFADARVTKIWVGSKES